MQTINVGPTKVDPINQNSTFTCRICFEEYQCISSIQNYNAYKYYGCCKDCLIESIKFNGPQPIDIPIGYVELLQICNTDEVVELVDMIMQNTIKTDPILREVMERKRTEKLVYLNSQSLIAIIHDVYEMAFQPKYNNDIVVTPLPNESMAAQLREKVDILVNDMKQAIVNTLKDCCTFEDLCKWIQAITSIFETMNGYFAFDGSHLIKRAIDELVEEYRADIDDFDDAMIWFALSPTMANCFRDLKRAITKFLVTRDKNMKLYHIKNIDESFKEYITCFEKEYLKRITSYAEMYVKKLKGDRSNIGKCECKNGVINKSTHICTSCNQISCDKCLRIISNGQEHECSKEDLELVAYYHSHCKNCPKCGTWIEKASGCNDMFCTECHALFDFVSGKQKYGNIHNPERIAYLNSIGQRDDSFNYTLSEISDHIEIITRINRDTFNDHTITDFTDLARKIMGTLDLKAKYIYDKYQVPKAAESLTTLGVIFNLSGIKGFHQVDSSQETPLDTSLVKQYSFFMFESDEKIVKLLYGMSYIWNYEKERREAMSIIGPKICALSQILLQSSLDINQIKGFIMDTCKEIDEKVGGSHINQKAVMIIN